MKLTKSPPRVQVKAAFYGKDGTLKASGTMSAIPWNPFPVEMCQVFQVSLNHRWHLVQIEEAHPDKGWVAVAVSDCEEELERFPRVRLVESS